MNKSTSHIKHKARTANINRNSIDGIFQWLLRNKLLQNVSLWILYFVWLYSINNFGYEISLPEKIAITVGYIFPLFPAVMLNHYFILPLLERRKFFQALLIYSTIITSFVFLYPILEMPIHNFPCWFVDCVDYGERSRIIDRIFALILTTVTAFALRTFRDSLLRRGEDKKMKLKLLKSQLHPEFLFDTLRQFSNLAASKSDELPDLMLKLSDLLRFSLYESKEKWVSLNREYQVLENYLKLERLRKNPSLKISLKHSGDFNQTKIAPMIFVALLEPIFIYMRTVVDVDQSLDSFLGIHNNVLEFKCTIKFPQNSSAIHSVEAYSRLEEDITKNKERLDFIYPNRHALHLIRNELIVEMILRIEEPEINSEKVMKQLHTIE